MHGEGAMTNWMWQKEYLKFCARDFWLDDVLQFGGPAEVNSNQTETIIENSQRSVTQEIDDILKISKSIKLLLKMKNVFYFMEKN